MITLRCTRHLLDRLHARVTADVAPTSRLGDWYANEFAIGRSTFVIAVSERSLLPIIVPTAPVATLLPQFVAAVVKMLRAIGVDESVIAIERREMSQGCFGRTKNRRVIGSITEFIRMVSDDLTIESCHEEAVQLSKAPCSPIDMKSPETRTLELLSTEL